MSFVTAAVIGGSAVAGLAGAYMTSQAAGDAADKQAGAAKYAADLQNNQYQQTRADQAPYRQAGAAALGQMQDPSFQHDFGAADFQTDPGYQFRLQQGTDAIQRSAAALGNLGSGSTLKALTNYSQDFASNEYQNAYTRFTNNQQQRFGRLASLASLGQTGNSVTAQAGMNAANMSGEAAMGGANAAGAAGIASSNAWGGALSGTANAGMQGLMLSRLLPQQQPTAAPQGPWQPPAGQTVTPLSTLPANENTSIYAGLAQV